MKKLLSIALLGTILFGACESSNTDNKDANTTIAENAKVIAETTAEKGNAGSGVATAKVGDQEVKIEGVCGAVTSMGSLSIAINDKDKGSNSMIISFAGTELPTATKTFKVIGYSENKKDDEVSISFVNFKDNGMNNWDSKDDAGTITIEVNGNELKCSFADITLHPSEMYNKAPLDKPAKLAGQFSLKK